MECIENGITLLETDIRAVLRPGLRLPFGMQEIKKFLLVSIWPMGRPSSNGNLNYMVESEQWISGDCKRQ